MFQNTINFGLINIEACDLKTAGLISSITMIRLPFSLLQKVFVF